MKKTRVGVLYGGRSVEHDISILSAKNIIANIDKDLFDVFLFFIEKNGNWFLLDSVDQSAETGIPLTLSLSTQKPIFNALERRIEVDVVFPVLHGTDGEDGSIQGLLQTVGIPYVGSGVLGSAASMDKLLSKRVLQSAGLPVASFVNLSDGDKANINYTKLVAQLGSPMIVKPANLGSSVGVSKVSSEAEFEKAIDEAFQYDHSILVEEFIDAREVECAIFGNENPIVSVAGEVKLADNYEFYSFTAKYEDPNSASIEIPAKMPDEIHAHIKQLSLQAYQLLNCKDLSRVDLFVKDDGSVYVNEINTIPGFTNISMYPSLINHEGIEYTEIISRLIQMAQDRFNDTHSISTDYESQL